MPPPPQVDVRLLHMLYTENIQQVGGASCRVEEHPVPWQGKNELVQRARPYLTLSKRWLLNTHKIWSMCHICKPSSDQGSCWTAWIKQLTPRLISMLLPVWSYLVCSDHFHCKWLTKMCVISQLLGEIKYECKPFELNSVTSSENQVNWINSWAFTHYWLNNSS